mmetsp:Transcript_26728/g.53711  ORF Transcript_26728/g.53711 Transcript_26728/m.53711 type:complete len:86 (+) Transcript_26728:72-329(+)
MYVCMYLTGTSSESLRAARNMGRGKDKEAGRIRRKATATELAAKKRVHEAKKAAARAGTVATSCNRSNHNSMERATARTFHGACI